MNRRVVITGIGMLCSIGTNKIEVLNALISEKSGLKKSKQCIKYDELKDVKVGECEFNTKEFTDIQSLERLEIMAMKAIDEALIDSRLTIDDIEKKEDRAALSLSTSLAGSSQMLKTLEEPEISDLWSLHSRRFMSRIMNQYKVKGSCYTTSSACAAGTAGAGIGFDLVKNNEADIVIVGGTDHLSMFSVFGFYSLNTLSSDECKPFDVNRDGINIGEGSAFFIFEELECARNRGVDRFYGEVLGYGLANDAYHMTSPNPSGEGAYQVMKAALEDSGIGKEEVDYINAHGTGTKANDQMEISAINRLFQENVKVSSTKSRVGHCLGAAGSIEIGICLFALSKDIYPHTKNSYDFIEEGKKMLDRETSKKQVNCILSNSFAFAGNLASIVIKKFTD